MATRHNLSPNPALKTSDSGWFGNTGSARVTGAAGLERATAFEAAGSPDTIATPRADITAGTTYTASVQILPAFTGNVTVSIDWYSASGFLDGGAGAHVVAVANGVAERLYVTATAPVADEIAPGSPPAVELVLTATYAADGTLFTAHLVEEGTAEGSYFDGDSAGASWDSGTDGTSTLVTGAEDPPGAPSVGTADFGADAAVAPAAPAAAGDYQLALYTSTVNSTTETWLNNPPTQVGPANDGWTLQAALNTTTPNSNVPDRGNTGRVELWSQDTPGTGSVSWTKSGTSRYSAVRISWPGVDVTGVTFGTPTQTNGQTSHTTASVTPPANTACKVVAVAVVDQGPTPVTLDAPTSPWSSVFSQNMPTPQGSETQSVRVVEQTIAADPSPDPVTATFTTSGLEECFLVAFILPGVADATGEVEGAGTVALGALTVAATGQRVVLGSGAVALGALTVAAAGEVDDNTEEGAGTVALGALTVAATGQRVVLGAGMVALGALTVAATGVGPAVLGAATVALGGLTVAASGVVEDAPGVPFLPHHLGPTASLTVEVAFGADLTDTTGASWTWTDVTQDVRQSPGISTKAGRGDEASTSQPAQMSLVLDNTSGDYSLGGVSRWWPYVRRNTPVRVRVDPGDGGGRRVLFHGGADGWTPAWDSLTGQVPVVQLSASGTLRRIAQGSAPTPSAYRRAMEAEPSVMAYWPCEEGEAATYAPAVRGGTPLTFTGRPDWAASDAFVCSASLPVVRDAYFNADVLPYPDTGEHQVRALIAFPDDTPDGVVLMHIHTSGSIARFDVTYEGAPGALGMYIYRRDGTQHPGTVPVIGFAVDGQAVRLSVEIEQVGADVGWSMSAIEAVPGGVPGGFSGVLEDETCGVVTHIEVDPHSNWEDIAFGHLTVGNQLLSGFAAQEPLIAFEGETTTSARLPRIAEENSLALTVYGTAPEPFSPYDTMGPQLVAPLLELLRECETADQGQLWDGRDAGLSYTTRRRREEAEAALTIDAGAGELAGAFAPTDDDQRTRNRVEARITRGISATYEDRGGPLGTAAVGIYDSSVTVNNASDVTAVQYAAWLVHLGTQEGYRVPTLTIDARATPELAAVALDLIPGDRVDLVNADQALAGFPPGLVALIVEGIGHDISAEAGWRITLQCSPCWPWAVARAAATTGDTGEHVARADTSAAEVTADRAAGATSLQVTTTDGPAWTTDADDYPLELDVGGVPVVATSCTGATSPQTFTVQALPVARAAGAPVRLHNPRPLGL